MDRILTCYVRAESEALVKNMDQGLDRGKLKADDTTMIIVDLEDYLGKTLAHERYLTKTTVPRLKSLHAGYRMKQRKLGIAVEDYTRRIGNLEQTVAGLQQDLQFKDKDLADANSERDLYHESLKEMTARSNEEQEKNIGKDKVIEELRLENRTLSEKKEEVEGTWSLVEKCFTAPLVKIREEYRRKKKEWLG